MPTERAVGKRLEHELLLRSKLLRIAEPGLAPIALGLAKEETFAPGEALYRAGDRSDCFHALVSGAVELAQGGAPPRIVEDPFGLGLLDVLADRPRPLTATAVTRVRAMKVRADDYLDLLEEHFELVMSTLRGITRGVHEASLALAPDGGFAEVPCPPGSALDLPSGPLGVVRKIGLLREAAVFRGANMQALVRLASLAGEGRFQAGDTVFERGEAAGKLYVVARGVVEARREAPALSARFQRADLVCGHGAFGPADDEYVATAYTHAIVLSFREEDFFDVMEEHFELTRSVLAGIASEYERLLALCERRLGAAPALSL